MSLVRREDQQGLELGQHLTQLQPDIGHLVGAQAEEVVEKVGLEVGLGEQGDGHFTQVDEHHPGPAAFGSRHLRLDPAEDPGPVATLDGEPEDHQEGSGGGYPTGQSGRLQHPVKQQRDELVLDSDGADAVWASLGSFLRLYACYSFTFMQKTALQKNRWHLSEMNLSSLKQWGYL